MSLVVETLWEVLPATPAAAMCFTKHIKDAAMRGVEVSKMFVNWIGDCSGVLLCNTIEYDVTSLLL